MRIAARYNQFALILAFGCACGVHPSTPHPSVVDAPTPSALTIRIDTVIVSAQQANGTPWDGPQQTTDSNAGCGVFSALVELGVGMSTAAIAAPLAGKAADYLCRDAPKRQERDATNPDLQVRLRAGDVAPYGTEVVADVTQATFGQSFVVPLDAVPPDGLIVDVADRDGADGEQQIGAVRLTRYELLAALRSPTRLMVREQRPTLLKLELVVGEHHTPSAEVVAMPASDGTKLATRDVAAGEVVRVVASGTYRVGSWYDADVTPIGYPGGGPTGFNLAAEPLKSAPHACAFVLLGDRDRAASLVRPATAFIAPIAGSLHVGVNDREPDNNTGTLTFTIERRAPTVEEWRSHSVAP